MWKFLGEAIMRKLKSDYEEQDNKYDQIIRKAEKDIMDEQVSGHEAAMRIINAIFKDNERAAK